MKVEALMSKSGKFSKELYPILRKKTEVLGIRSVQKLHHASGQAPPEIHLTNPHTEASAKRPGSSSFLSQSRQDRDRALLSKDKVPSSLQYFSQFTIIHRATPAYTIVPEHLVQSIPEKKVVEDKHCEKWRCRPRETDEEQPKRHKKRRKRRSESSEEQSLSDSCEKKPSALQLKGKKQTNKHDRAQSASKAEKKEGSDEEQTQPEPRGLTFKKQLPRPPISDSSLLNEHRFSCLGVVPGISTKTRRVATPSFAKQRNRPRLFVNNPSLLLSYSPKFSQVEQDLGKNGLDMARASGRKTLLLKHLHDLQYARPGSADKHVRAVQLEKSGSRPELNESMLPLYMRKVPSRLGVTCVMDKSLMMNSTLHIDSEFNSSAEFSP